MRLDSILERARPPGQMSSSWLCCLTSMPTIGPTGKISAGVRPMDDWRPDRAAKKAAMPASSLFLASTFHASIIFALLWLPLTRTPALVPDDAVQLTIERQPVAAVEPPVVSPPVEPPAP